MLKSRVNDHFFFFFCLEFYGLFRLSKYGCVTEQGGHGGGNFGDWDGYVLSLTFLMYIIFHFLLHLNLFLFAHELLFYSCLFMYLML